MSITYTEVANDFLNVSFLTLHRRWGAIRTGLDFVFEFDFDNLSSNHNSGAFKDTLTLSNLEAKLYSIENNEVYLGKLIPRKPTISLPANLKSNIVFKLDLTFSELRQLEKLKETSNIQFLAIFAFSSDTEAHTQSKRMHEIQLRFNLNKSDWTEIILSRWRFFRRPLFSF